MSAVRAIIWALVFVGLAGSARADVRIEVESEEVFQGVPFEVTLHLGFAREYGQASMVPSEDFAIVQSRSETRIFNGRVSLVYRVVARRTGVRELPPFTIRVDGARHETPGIPLRVLEVDEDDGFRAEIRVSDRTPFLGEPLELTLRVFVAPFVARGPSYRGTLSLQDMWSRVNFSGSRFGPFDAALRDRSGAGSLTGRREMLPDADGVDRLTYVYEISVPSWPDRAETLTFDGVELMMDYPIRVERSRSILNPGLRFPQTRPIVARAEAPEVVIRPIPQDGRPASYAGAVGRFDFAVQAAPLDVAVGDPITLTMTVRDRTPAGTRLDLLAPPKLETQPGLADGFRLSPDPPTGIVEPDAKVFTTTIRAARADLTAVPPITFSWFDPDSESFGTAASAPIDLTVRRGAGEVQIEGAVPEATPTEMTRNEGGVRPLVLEPSAMLGRVETGFSPLALVLLTVPPLAFAGVFIIQMAGQRRTADPDGRRRRAAGRRARARLAGAADAGAIESALTHYVADRTRSAPGALTAREALTRIEASVSADVAGEAAAVLRACEQARYGATDAAASAELAKRARASLDALERESFG